MSVTINGVTYEGRNVTVSNGIVRIDGQVVSSKPTHGILEVKVTGTLHNLESDASVNCEDVAGDVHSGGSVNADNIGGNVNAGGSVNCDNVGGNINAGGSVRHG